MLVYQVFSISILIRRYKISCPEIGPTKFQFRYYKGKTTMGRVIRAQRKGNPKSIYGTHGLHRIAPAKFRVIDFVERKG